MHNKFIISMFLLGFCSAAYPAKDRLILMPVNGADSEDAGMIYRAALAEALNNQYEVLSGTQVDRSIEEIFEEESRKTNCTEEACYKAMVLKFQAELMGVARIHKSSGGYMMSFQIHNLLENTQKFSTIAL
jgi:hypothetical protein